MIHANQKSKTMELIEKYRHAGTGYNPFLINRGWQVAQLNYMTEQDLLNIDKMDRHLLTDEVFVLLKGNAILIAASLSNETFEFEYTRMEEGVTYNIPKTVWHNIAMTPGAEVIIIEKDNTHLGDFEYQPLSERERQELRKKVTELNNN